MQKNSYFGHFFKTAIAYFLLKEKIKHILIAHFNSLSNVNFGFYQGPGTDIFRRDYELERMYEETLNVDFDDEYEKRVESEMVAVLNEVDRIGSDLGIITSSRMQEVDASWLTRWLIGEEKDLVPPKRR